VNVCSLPGIFCSIESANWKTVPTMRSLTIVVFLVFQLSSTSAIPAEFDGVWEVFVKSEKRSESVDTEVFCPNVNESLYSIVSQSGEIRNSATKAPVRIDQDGKFGFSTSTGSATVTGQFNGAGSGNGEIIWNRRIALSDGPGCRWSFALSRKQSDLSLAIENRDSIMTIKTNIPNCRQLSYDEDLAMAPTHGTIEFLPRENHDECIIDVHYIGDEGYIGFDHVVIMDQVSDNPFRHITDLKIDVRGSEIKGSQD